MTSGIRPQLLGSLLVCIDSPNEGSAFNAKSCNLLSILTSMARKRFILARERGQIRGSDTFAPELSLQLPNLSVAAFD